MDENEDLTQYKVVLNHEEQYSIWPADRENPLGWRDDGFKGDKAACLEHIKTVWTDMRPLSLRKRMEELARQPVSDQEPEIADDLPPLVDRLSTGMHRAEITIRPERTIAALRQCLARGYVHVKFTETRGGTELGIRLDQAACRVPDADLDRGAGRVHLEGTLTLDYVPVRVVADIDLATMTGEGRLVKEQPAAA